MFKPLVEKASELKKDVNQKIDTSDNSSNIMILKHYLALK
jgi:hypothetical protein